MTQIVKIYTLLVLSVSLISCGNNSQNDHTGDNRGDYIETSEDSIALSHNTGITIELNDGEKWRINDEMKPYIAQGDAALTDFMAANDTDYKALADKLKATNNQLIASCTMDGTSHDELHKWLHPHLQLVADLKAAPNQEQAREVMKKLQKSYSDFWIYFQ